MLTDKSNSINTNKKEVVENIVNPTVDRHENDSATASRNDDNLATKQPFIDVKPKKKNRSIVILGDSILKDVEQYKIRNTLNTNEKVFVKSFSGATVEDMKSHVIPSKNRNNDLVILHCGTNDLRSKSK